MTLKNQKGMITFDFIFAFVVGVSLMMVLFAVCVSLATIEVGQYVTYSVSRAYLGAHETPGQQSELAQARFKEAMAEPAFKTFLAGGFVDLGTPTLGDYTEEYPETEPTNHIFVGARIPVNAKLLNLFVPFLGPTVTDSKVGQATLNSYLTREVSTQECREGFNRSRFQQLKQLGPYSQAPTDQEILITDNGC